MSKKIFSDQSLSELKTTEKTQRSTVIIYTALLAISMGITAYYIYEKSFGLFAFIPLVFLPSFIFSLLNLKKVKDEIKVREKHILLQSKNI